MRGGGSRPRWYRPVRLACAAGWGPKSPASGWPRGGWSCRRTLLGEWFGRRAAAGWGDLWRGRGHEALPGARWGLRVGVVSKVLIRTFELAGLAHARDGESCCPGAGNHGPFGRNKGHRAQRREDRDETS